MNQWKITRENIKESVKKAIENYSEGDAERIMNILDKNRAEILDKEKEEEPQRRFGFRGKDAYGYNTLPLMPSEKTRTFLNGFNSGVTITGALAILLAIKYLTFK